VWSLLHSCGINNLVAVPTSLRVDLDYKLPTTFKTNLQQAIQGGIVGKGLKDSEKSHTVTISYR